MRRQGLIVLLIAAGCFVLPASAAQAQGLLWNLPKDGTWVRYEGTYKQVEFRPDSTEGDVAVDWIQHLTIKSVGSETAEYHGQMVPCRWIEIKVQTGKPSEAGVETGPVGARIFKVLVPEPRVVGKLEDSDKIPVSFIDVVKGFRKVGDGPVEPIKSGALQVFPLIAMVRHYQILQPEGNDPVDPQIPTGPVMARQYKAESRVESPISRTVSEAHLWRCETAEKSIPFGLAKWTVKTLREAKDNSEPRSAFKPISEVNVEMSAHEVGEGAQSELTTP